jgi:hypothetical protein
MKNTNRYKLVPVLIIGLVCSALNAFAELEMVMVDKGNSAVIKIREGEKGTIVTWLSCHPTNSVRGELTIIKDGNRINIKGEISGTESMVIPGPAEIKLASEFFNGSYSKHILTVETKPIEKHR